MSDRTPPLPNELRAMGAEWERWGAYGWGLMCDGYADLHMRDGEIRPGKGKRWPNLAWVLVGQYHDWTPEAGPAADPLATATAERDEALAFLCVIREIVDLPAGCGATEIVERVTEIKHDRFRLRQAEAAAGAEIERHQRIAGAALDLVELLRGVQP